MNALCRIVFGLLILLSCMCYAQEERTPVLETKLSLEVRHETIPAILKKISEKTPALFSYDAALFDTAIVKSFVVDDQPVGEILEMLLQPDYEYKIIGDQFVISEREDKRASKQTTEENAAVVFKGIVTDAEKKFKIAYVSISVKGRNLGTISNTDGEFELKIPEMMLGDSILISCLGYQQITKAVASVQKEPEQILLKPVSIQLREVKVTVIDAQNIIDRFRSKIKLNYPDEREIMTAFYREILMQDKQYIGISEALLEVWKQPYDHPDSEDKIKLIKGRKNLDIKPFSSVDFKIQGGPYYAMRLDIVKTLESFLAPENKDSYKFWLDEIIDFNDRGTYVVLFRPLEKLSDFSYQGKLYIDMSTLALVRADFSLSRQGLKIAHQLMIRKKPKSFNVRTTEAQYSVTYRKVGNQWHLNNATTVVSFRVKSKGDRVNSTFYSNSDLLITDFRKDKSERIKRNELFDQNDIFSEMITSYDENFWDEHNIITPPEELCKAVKDYYLKSDSLFNHNSNLKDQK